MSNHKKRTKFRPKRKRYTYSQLSTSGSSRKQTALPANIFFNSTSFFQVKLCIYTNFRKQTLFTVPDNFRGENWIFFCLRSLVSGHPMHNYGLLAKKFVFNLQINKNLTFGRATIQ